MIKLSVKDVTSVAGYNYRVCPNLHQTSGPEVTRPNLRIRSLRAPFQNCQFLPLQYIVDGKVF